MFLCHINDLPDSVKSQVCLFADDCLIFYRQINTKKNIKCSKTILKNLKNGRPILEYGAVVWAPYQGRDTIAIEKVHRQAARFIKTDYKSRFEGCVTLRTLSYQSYNNDALNQDWLCYTKLCRGGGGGTVPAINADELLIPLRNKRNIKPRIQTDFQTPNFVQRYAVNHTECFKIPDPQTDQFKNSFFVRTISERGQLEECQIRAETVNSFRTAVHKSY